MCTRRWPLENQIKLRLCSRLWLAHAWAKHVRLVDKAVGATSSERCLDISAKEVLFLPAALRAAQAAGI